MGEVMMQTEPEKGAVGHLHDALEADNPADKEFHIRQALQYIGIHNLDD